MTESTEPLNPYVVGRIVTGDDFFGRLAQLQRLRNVLLQSANPQHVSIVGETRSGKTCLLMEFLRQDEEPLSAKFCLAMLDLSVDFERGTASDFYRRLGDIAIDALAESGRDVSELSAVWTESLGSNRMRSIQLPLKKLLKRIAEDASPMLFVLDEFDNAPLLVEGDTDAFKILRSLGLYTKTTFVVASRAPIDEIEKDAGISSNFAGIFDLTSIDLAPLPEPEAMALCQEPLRRQGREWDSEVARQLIAVSGGHPYLLQGLCHRLLQETWGRPVQQQLISLSQIAPEVFRAFFGFLAKRLQRNGLLDPLQALLSGDSACVDRAHSDRLERLGYIFRPDAGPFHPFTPLLYESFGIARSNDSELSADEPPQDLLTSWGLCVGGCNLLVEGETDRDYLTTAARFLGEKTGEDLLDRLHIVPGGLGRRGGVGVVGRRLVAAIETARGSDTRIIALLDNDEMGRRIAEALDRLGAQKSKDYFLLDQADYPVRNRKHPVDVEIEDLLSRRLSDSLAEALPGAVEEKLDCGRDGVRYQWRGADKAQLVEIARKQGNAEDFERMCQLVRRIRKAFGLEFASRTKA